MSSKDKQSEQLITGDMSIMEIVQAFAFDNPDVIDIMQGYGLHCIGCGGAMFETLEQGVMAHGKPREELDALIQELNEAIMGS